MEKNYTAQVFSVNNSRVREINCNVLIKRGRVILKLQNNKETEYEIEHIYDYSNEKLITLKEKYDFSFSMLMSFASAVFMQISFVFSVILIALTVYDLYKHNSLKYIILSEQAVTKAEKKILYLLNNKRSSQMIKKAA